MDSLAHSKQLNRLPDQAQTELHRPASAVELMVVQEQVAGRHENISGAERIRVRVLVDRAIVCRQTYAEIAVIERVVSLGAELQRETLREFGGLQQRHIPDV